MKVLGVTALILAIILIFVPILGGYLVVIPALFAALAGGAGFTPGMVALLLNLVNLLFLSPVMVMNVTGGIKAGDSLPLLIFGGLILIQVVAGVILWSRKRKLDFLVREENLMRRHQQEMGEVENHGA
ncbi:MAG: hypothetical protein HQL52_01505 [Magnetococcales bacterium]|nr:hypothetical protein [Magnetococcales bacterium]